MAESRVGGVLATANDKEIGRADSPRYSWRLFYFYIFQKYFLQKYIFDFTIYSFVACRPVARQGARRPALGTYM